MKRTDEEKRAWHDKMKGFVKQVHAMTPEEQAELSKRMPIVTCEGHALSMYNQAFLSLQTGSPVTVVGGFKQWQRAGRKVVKGQHSAGYIYVPLIPTPKEGEKDIAVDPENVRFRLVPVFDVTQTEEMAEGVKVA
jgi:hypothetical protein